MMKYLKLVIVAACAISLTACAGFRTGDLGKVDGWTANVDAQKKKSVSYTLKMQSKRDDVVTDLPATGPAADAMKKELDEAFADSQLFNTIKSDGSPATVRIAVTTTGSGWGSPILGAISGATFGVIPAFANDTLTVRMSFLDANNKELGAVEKSEGVTMVIHLLMLPLTPFKFPFSEIKNSHQDIYRAVLKEAQSKGYI